MTEEELEKRAVAAEERGDHLEEKLMKLVELVKKDRAPKVFDAGAVNNVSNVFRKVKIRGI